MKAIYSASGRLLLEKDSDLQNANLQNADLQCADLQDTIVYSLGFSKRGYHFLLHLEEVPIINDGCRDFTIEQALSHWEGKEEIIKVKFAQLLIQGRDSK